MRYIFLLISLALFSFAPSDGGPETPITCKVENMPFVEFSAMIAKQANVKIFYQDEWVKDLKISIEADNLPASELLRKALAATSLKVSVWHGELVTLPNETLIEDIPSVGKEAQEGFH